MDFREESQKTFDALNMLFFMPCCFTNRYKFFFWLVLLKIFFQSFKVFQKIYKVMLRSLAEGLKFVFL